AGTTAVNRHTCGPHLTNLHGRDSLKDGCGSGRKRCKHRKRHNRLVTRRQPQTTRIYAASFPFPLTGTNASARREHAVPHELGESYIQSAPPILLPILPAATLGIEPPPPRSPLTFPMIWRLVFDDRIKTIPHFRGPARTAHLAVV